MIKAGGSDYDASLADSIRLSYQKTWELYHRTPIAQNSQFGEFRPSSKLKSMGLFAKLNNVEGAGSAAAAVPPAQDSKMARLLKEAQDIQAAMAKLPQ